MSERALVPFDRSRVLRTAPADPAQRTAPNGKANYWTDIVDDARPGVWEGEQLVSELMIRDRDVLRIWRVEPIDYDLPTRRAVAIAEIERGAKAARLLHITPDMDLVYEGKRRDAERFAADPALTAEDLPLLAAQLGIYGKDLAEAAAIVSAKAAQWSLIAATIESVRLPARAAVDAVADDTGKAGAAALDAVLASLVWPEA